MEIVISRYRECDTDTVFYIQRKAFMPLYDKYHDDSTNPYMETKELVHSKYTRKGNIGYTFILGGTTVGAVRISIDGDNKRGKISAL